VLDPDDFAYADEQAHADTSGREGQVVAALAEADGAVTPREMGIWERGYNRGRAEGERAGVAWATAALDDPQAQRELAHMIRGEAQVTMDKALLARSAVNKWLKDRAALSSSDAPTERAVSSVNEVCPHGRHFGGFYCEDCADTERERQLAQRPRITVLCGSTRFYRQFQEANYRLTMQGRIVLSVGFYPHSAEQAHGESVGITTAEKESLDELHKRKIDLADDVLVLDVDGYIGDSTRSEIEYAESLRKPITYLCADAIEAGQ